MNAFAMAAIMPTVEKFSVLTNSRRIFKPRMQTIFEAADKITPQFKAVKAAAGTERMKAVMETSSMRIMKALTPFNPLAGRNAVC